MPYAVENAVPHAPTLLVVSPHPDDDVLGCGGTVARAARDGSDVHVVYVTDGGASHLGSRRYPRRALAALREREARAGLRELGIRTTPAFLRFPDAELERFDDAGRERLVAALAATFERVRPDIVFGPWPRDPHGDHRVVGTCLAAALAHAPRPPRLAYYTVWLDERGNPADRPHAGETGAFDVTLSRELVAVKRRAIRAHRSQTTGLIGDAARAFRLPPTLLAHALRGVERFYVPAHSA